MRAIGPMRPSRCGELLADGHLERGRGEALERVLHLARRQAALDDRRAGGLAESGVLGMHRGQREQARLARRRRHPRARHAVAPAREGGAGDDHLGAALLRLLDELGGELGVRGGVVVAAERGRDDLVLVAEQAGELAPGPGGAVAHLRPGARGVLAAHAGEELVDVVDDLHASAGSGSAQVSRPQPSVLCAQ